nr:hypothetical protein [Nocardioides anomalus]
MDALVRFHEFPLTERALNLIAVDATAVVGDDHLLDGIGLVSNERHVDAGRLGVDRVPRQLNKRSCGSFSCTRRPT